MDLVQVVKLKRLNVKYNAPVNVSSEYKEGQTLTTTITVCLVGGCDVQ